jgi:arginyl-tRNA synthetase
MDYKIAQIIQHSFGLTADVLLTRPDPKFGDYSTNVALKIAKGLGKTPKEVAEKIAAELKDFDEVGHVLVQGPGFINIFVSDKFLIDLTNRRPINPYENQKIVLEYSCPNAFKELHAGHLYQTIFGDILSRLFEKGGAELHRTSFGGDVGLHVAKCLWGIVSYLGGEEPEKMNDVEVNPLARAKWISDRYVEGSTAFENNDTVKKDINRINSEVYAFHKTQNHDSPLAKIYWISRQWSLDYFDAFYALLKVETLRYYPESETTQTGLKIVHEQLEQGRLKISDGAVIFEGDQSQNLHTRVFITSRGLPTYETKDIGVIQHEKQDYNFDHRYLITGNDQSEYMRVVFAAAELFDPELIGKMTHLTNGTVRFADGEKMSSRLGNVTRAIDVIDAVKQKVEKLVSDKSIIEDVTLGAVKYIFAKYRLGGDISFDINETVSLQGNSGPYIQYAHARARRILEKADQTPGPINHIREEDRNLVRKLSEYPDVLDLAIHSLEPHHICHYLFELAQEFNRFYEKNQVIGAEYEKHRLGLVHLYADTLQRGLKILGIAAPEKM